ncbi:hypothetical protein [Wolbachia endosymbiont (group B) of Horisme vitalbata]|uniref:hypothetical protein n=1 Tax=Wolbachia endosymbiont (group B) of Horisme vitalbata TaxID=3066178 RepID=UPI0033423B26
MANANLAFSKETLQHLAELSELTKQPAQALAEKLLREAIDSEMEDFLLSVVADQYDIENEKKN